MTLMNSSKRTTLTSRPREEKNNFMERQKPLEEAMKSPEIKQAFFLESVAMVLRDDATHPAGIVETIGGHVARVRVSRLASLFIPYLSFLLYRESVKFVVRFFVFPSWPQGPRWWEYTEEKTNHLQGTTRDRDLDEGKAYEILLSGGMSIMKLRMRIQSSVCHRDQRSDGSKKVAHILAAPFRNKTAQ